MAALLRLGAAAAVLGLLYLGGLVWFAATIPREGPVDARATDAIVVLTGGQLRLREGLRLMAEGKAKKLLVSGVNRNVELQELLRAAAFVAREKIASLRLVTANYHLRRATLEFRRAMPDIDLVAQPVYPENFHIDEWWRWPGTYALLQAEYHKYLGALLRPYLAFADANP